MRYFMKQLLIILLTLLVQLGSAFGITYSTDTKFIDFAFVIGLAITVSIGFFTSKGGVTSQYLDKGIQGETGMKTEQQKFEFSPNIAFITSLACTFILLAVTLYHYRSYF